jgi:DNA-binding response OmpR family regulator
MKRILIVDDDVNTIEFLRLLLQQYGYEIFSARDGCEAVEILETQPVNLILTDVAMPRLNGYQLCQQVKSAANPHLALIPVVLMSCRTLDSDIRYAKALGADDYLTKPFVIEDLLAVVEGKLLAAERLQVLFVQQAGGPQMVTLVINQQQVKLDYRQHRAWIGKAEIDLTAREMFLFEKFARQPNEVISLADLVKATHDLTTDHQEASQLVRPLIRTLRRKLEFHLGHEPCIKNVRARGYLLLAELPRPDFSPVLTRFNGPGSPFTGHQ